MIQEEYLSIYQCTPTEVGPVIGLSVTIKEDFTWILSYRHQLVPREHCGLLENVPISINSGKEV